jgi:aspartyl-tRNA(Asn)/glutamyl-tRNA(Gln) amidotransferase subunit B
MFCGCKNDPDEERPNVNVCPVCMGHPGTLPTLNAQAIENVLKLGLALDSKIAEYTEWDRKNYFYPDIPKGYQISQYAHPLVRGGSVRGVEITRVHLEEDTGSNIHEGEQSKINYNRAGVPLMELVTEPVIHSGEQAGAFARELQLILRTLGIAEANMEKGEMRVEANISVSQDPEKFGTKVEVKNLNSFKAVERAISFEIKRQQEVILKGEKVVQETRGWDDAGQKTYSQRAKEDSHDYRYFPDPDLPKLLISKVWNLESLKADLPLLPQAKRELLKKEFDLKDGDIEIYVDDVEEKTLGKLFKDIAAQLGTNKASIQLASNIICSDLKGYVNKNIKTTEAFTEFVNKYLASGTLAIAIAELVRLYEAGTISSRGVKDLLPLLLESSQISAGLVEKLATEKGFIQKNDPEELKRVLNEVIVANKTAADEYKAGKEASLMFLVGQGMKAMKGAGNPQLIKETLRTLLGK